ncbi:hypothetical protein BH20CHL6_BH20CHL6_12390 [soil metagenome]
MAEAGRVGEAGETDLGVASAPQLHGHDRDTQIGRDALDGHALGRAKHDAGPYPRSLLARRRPGDGPERCQIGLVDDQRGSCWTCHGEEGSGHHPLPLDISETRFRHKWSSWRPSGGHHPLPLDISETGHQPCKQGWRAVPTIEPDTRSQEEGASVLCLLQSRQAYIIIRRTSQPLPLTAKM